MAEKCLTTNYNGAKETTEAFLPLLQLSNSSRIVNVSSRAGQLENIANEWAKGVLNDAENLTEERIDEVLKEFIKDFKQGSLENKGWPTFLSAYRVSKAALNSYTRIVAKKHPSMYAVVTGANKGIGFETVKVLASNGIKVVLTARDEKRGHEAIERFREFGLSDLVIFHQLDVTHSASIASLVDFVKTQFGKLDILVNNAGINGVNLDEVEGSTIKWEELTQTYEMVEKCLTTNYYGAKETTKAFLPLLQLSNSARIVNVSSRAGQLVNIANEWAKGVLDDVENLTEERIDEVLQEFIKDFKQGSLVNKGWPNFFLPAYMVSKAALNSYTRIVAKKHPNMCINSVCPGFVKTDINRNTGIFSLDQGAANVVRYALLPHGSPSGLFFIKQELT
ncbi:(+)-neomenthol dehydrogenase [Mucuna pruriens]|uniref:(+)-neomenthol dehydrogenase n=1 Tax=Mucuna pruriens TaxID=157652 RepID=A0A371EIL3_MUCPR|nr:(+)-neomenthol dehydrogenase [Mucuna pruriens]